jgi:OmpA-OmpF porin, OOP family
MKISISNSIKTIGLGVAVSFLASCSHTPAIQEFSDTADASAEVTQLENDMARDMREQVDVLAPTNFKKASNSLSSARKSLDQQKDSKDTLHLVAVGRAYLNRANVYAGVAHTNLESVIVARRDALTAGASRFFSDDFTRADRQLTRVTEDLEDNDTEDAIEHRGELQSSYMALELRAIKETALSGSRAAIESAKTEGAAEYAPMSLAIAQKSLADSDAFINANRHSPKAVAARSAETRRLSDHLLKITQEARAAKKVSPEEAALRSEAAANRIKSEENRVDAGVVQLRINQGKLQDERDSNRALTANNNDLQSSAAFNRSFEEARAEFTESEAQVYKQGNALVIRLRGLEFASGQSSLGSGSFPLLAKVQKVMNGFGDSTVVIEGHTDSVGGKAINAKISAGRALAVKDYLIANQEDESLDISSIGYDYQKPLSSNKTASGRAENRRVDVVIEAKDPAKI